MNIVDLTIIWHTYLLSFSHKLNTKYFCIQVVYILPCKTVFFGLDVILVGPIAVIPCLHSKLLCIWKNRSSCSQAVKLWVSLGLWAIQLVMWVGQKKHKQWHFSGSLWQLAKWTPALPSVKVINFFFHLTNVSNM